MNPYKPRVKVADPFWAEKTYEILSRYGVTTVCEESACPNRGECYSRKSATFMILGKFCTRSCGFCKVKTKKNPPPPDEDEPLKIARAVKELGLNYVVITSVDRDDLEDFGALRFKECVEFIKRENPRVKIELLTPDFNEDAKALQTIVSSGAEKLAHNAETVRRLSPIVRPQGDYDRSLRVLEFYAENFKGRVKSSLMVGLGEREYEIKETMRDLLNAGVEEITIGQYLSPSKKHRPVSKYYSPEFFDYIRKEAVSMGFKAVAAGILVRSSYFAQYL